MKRNKDIRMAIWIMTGSLLLLSVFVSLWLTRVYQDEHSDLQKEVDFLFEGAVRNLEDELIRDSGDKPVILRLKDTLGLSKIESSGKAFSFIDSIFIATEEDQVAATIFADSLIKDANVITTVTIERDSFAKQNFPPNLKIHVESNGNSSPHSSEFSGSLSLFIKKDKDHAFDFSKRHLLIERLIGESFAKMLEQTSADLPANYVVRTQAVVNTIEHELISKGYNDIFMKKNIVVAFPDYQSFLFKKIWSEMLFSLLLLLSVAFAFVFIYKSLIRQKRLAELKDDLIRNITHELKTPITTVGVAIEALRDFDAQKEPEKLNEYLDISKYELNRLSILVDKVLKMSLFENKAPTLNLETIDLKTIIEEVLNSLKIQFKKQQAKVDFQTTGTEFILQGDRVHLTNVIYNLLENALKYSENTPEIEITLTDNNQKIQLTVGDRGIGIPPPYIDKVFDKFFRVPTGDKHNVKGYGLGLAYVKNVVEQHGGQIKVKNREGGGALFSIRF